MVERSTRYVMLLPLKNKDAHSVRLAMQWSVKHLPQSLKKSLTYDRGKGMSEHKLFTKNSKMQVYFTDRYSPWKRGKNENTNGLIRQFFPKGTDFNEVSHYHIKKVERLLNERPNSGSAKLGNADAADLELHCLRKRVILVTQENHIFAATLRENLALRSEPTDDKELWDALQTVGATWAFDLFDGLDTMLETSDFCLRTGEKQQIALARAIATDPDIVIFDESFAALDIQSKGEQDEQDEQGEKGELEESIFSVLKNKTVIVIAHQLNVISDQTRILVMAGGKILEDGSHQRLLAQRGVYSELWKSWSSES